MPILASAPCVPSRRGGTLCRAPLRPLPKPATRARGTHRELCSQGIQFSPIQICRNPATHLQHPLSDVTCYIWISSRSPPIQEPNRMGIAFSSSSFL